jgi:hypothetical protein
MQKLIYTVVGGFITWRISDAFAEVIYESLNNSISDSNQTDIALDLLVTVFNLLRYDLLTFVICVIGAFLVYLNISSE